MPENTIESVQMEAIKSHEPLTERERLVLNLIVENFIRSAVPVGSRMIAKKVGMTLSSATIRNVMGDLEERGYLTHPHTSAGRVPTDKGYRFYVDSLMGVEALSEPEKQKITEQLVRVSKEVDVILDAASQVLARVSSQLGVVLSPRFFQGIFTKIELVPVADKKVLMVLTINSGLVRTIMLKMDAEVSREVLECTAEVINERLNGLSLQEIKRTLDGRLRDLNVANPELVLTIANSMAPQLEQVVHRNFHFGGTNNIMAQPEFSDQQKLSNVLNLLESREILIHLFEQNDSMGDLSIAIGEENREELIKYCSLITTSYHIGGVSGTLGVLGPTRMHYSKVVALVDFMAKALSNILTEEAGGSSAAN